MEEKERLDILAQDQANKLAEWQEKTGCSHPEAAAQRIERAEGILKTLVLITNTGGAVTFEDDWGGNSLTVSIDGNHTHVGLPEGTFEDLLEQLKNVLAGGPGLSFHPETPKNIVDNTK